MTNCCQTEQRLFTARSKPLPFYARFLHASLLARGVATVYTRTYVRTLKSKIKIIYLFVCLFVYRFVGEKRLLQMQELFSHCIAAILHKENFVNIGLFI